MRFRIAVVLALLLGFFTSSASAQVTYGIKGGVGFASLAFEEDDEDFYGNRTGFLIGASADIPASTMFSVLVEFLYAQKGAHGEEAGFEETVKLDYIEIPILANFPINMQGSVSPFVYAGVAPAFNVSANSVFEFEGVEEEDELEEVESFDMGLVFGGGVRFGQMAIEARYNLGCLGSLMTPRMTERSRTGSSRFFSASCLETSRSVE